MPKTKKCPYCRSDIDKKAKICPHCQKKQFGIGSLFSALIVILFLIISIPLIAESCSSSSDSDEEPERSVEVVTTEAQEKKENTTKKAKAEKKETTEPETEAQTEQETEKETEPETEAPTEPANDISKVMYDANGIRITLVGIESDDNSIFPTVNLKVLIENDTDEEKCVQVRQFSINGFMIDPYFSPEIAAHKKINDKITIDAEDLENNGITFDTIQDIELSFHIFNWDNWDSYIDTDPVVVSVK